MSSKFLLKFDGDLAEQHQISIYEGGESLAGLGLSFQRVSHYLLTGKVRYKAPYDHRFRLVIEPPRRGSVDFSLVALLSEPLIITTIGALAVGISANAIYDTTVYLLKKITSSKQEKTPESIEQLAATRPGDLDALAASIVSPAKRAHSVINHGAGAIVINGDNNSIILDSSTKSYLHSMEDDVNDMWLDGSVGWINANSRSGGIFIESLGRSIPFDIMRAVSSHTLRALAKRNSEYWVRKNSSLISVRVTAKRAPDGSIKRFTLIEAKELFEEL